MCYGQIDSTRWFIMRSPVPQWNALSTTDGILSQGHLTRAAEENRNLRWVQGYGDSGPLGRLDETIPRRFPLHVSRASVVKGPLDVTRDG